MTDIIFGIYVQTLKNHLIIKMMRKKQMKKKRKKKKTKCSNCSSEEFIRINNEKMV